MNQDRKFYCRVECDSISPDNHRVTTFVLRFPRKALAEFNTHRIISRSARSSRAVPVWKMIREVITNPFVPIHWGANQKGMQAESEVEADDRIECVQRWLSARDAAVAMSTRFLSGPDRDELFKQCPETRRLERLISCVEPLKTSVHKQEVNRLLEPFAWTDVVTTGTHWANFFALRTHQDASPEFRLIARMMYLKYLESTPRRVHYGEWHLPFIRDTDWREVNQRLEDGMSEWSTYGALRRWSAARCARVSYSNHEGVRSTADDEAMYTRLTDRIPKHVSPLDHPCTPVSVTSSMKVTGHLQGWQPLRKHIDDECIDTFSPPAEELQRWREEIRSLQNAGVVSSNEVEI